MEIMSVVGPIIPIIIPFVLGLVVGLLLKTALKLAVGIVAVAVLLSWAGYNVPSIQEFFQRAKDTLPQLMEGEGFLSSLVGSLPYTTPAFVIGLALGVWFS